MDTALGQYLKNRGSVPVMANFLFKRNSLNCFFYLFTFIKKKYIDIKSYKNLHIFGHALFQFDSKINNTYPGVLETISIFAIVAKSKSSQALLSF